MYFEFLKLLEDNKLQHKDGFQGDKFIAQEKIAYRLKEFVDNCEKIFLYLHGSWLFQQNQENGDLRKLSFSKNNEKEWTIEDLFNNDSCSPFLILEDRWRVKEAIIKSDVNPYLQFCYRHLKNLTGKLLVFGVSFNNDEHILHALNNSKFEEIFITYKSDGELKNIREKIPKESKKYKFIRNNVKNCIWTHNAIDDALRNGYEAWKAFLYELSDGNTSRYMADIEDGNSEEFPECIENVKNSKTFEDLYDDNLGNNLYHHLILEPIRNTDVADDLDFDELKTSILISLSNMQLEKSFLNFS